MDTWNSKVYEREDEEYPCGLEKMNKPPERVWCIGDMSLLQKQIVCIVGSRKPSEYGIETVRAIVKGLAAYNVCILSGLAYGIDIIAHTESLVNSIPTIALPGSGLDRASLYPQAHAAIAKQIVQTGGLLLSAFPPQQSSAKWLFPMRNIYLATLSCAVIVVECTEDSGTMYTAEAAVTHDIPCYAVPGPVSSVLSSGPHMLIQSGQNIFTNVARFANDIGLRLNSMNTISKIAEAIYDRLHPYTVYTRKRIYRLTATSFPHLTPEDIDVEIHSLEYAGLIDIIGDTIQKTC